MADPGQGVHLQLAQGIAAQAQLFQQGRIRRRQAPFQAFHQGQGIAQGAVASESWRGAFGLTVTLVWLYLELLRLLSYFNRN